MSDIEKALVELRDKIEQAMKRLALDDDRERLTVITTKMSEPDFWQDTEQAAKLSKEHAALEKRITAWDSLHEQVQDGLELARLEDSSLEADLKKQLQNLEEAWHAREFELTLSGAYDKNNAILNFHAGTGGTDAQDWAQMLLRMYMRWASDHDYETTLLGESPGEEAGIKSATLRVHGEYAYGKLKGEHGVHRLVRLSPFNADNLRQTSFALVEVIPEIEEVGDALIDETDLRIDVYRSGGKGGQSVNTTDSAVRVTHLPTGIVVAIQNERSQLQNRETAMKILRSKLLHLKEQQRKDQISELKGEVKGIEWGQQIRSYVMQPYTMVKDNRTQHETSDVQAVLNGEIDGFIDAYLTQNIGAA